MALKFDPELFSQATANLPTTPTPQAAEQQAASSLPPIEPKQRVYNFASDAGNITNADPASEAIERVEEAKKKDEYLENNREEFIARAKQLYGIDPENGTNKLNYKQLDERMREDKLTSSQVREVQQLWIASAEHYRDSLPGGKHKDDLTAQIEKIKQIPMTIKEDDFFGINKVSESWRNASPALEAQVERGKNAAVQRFGLGFGMMTDTEILEKYDPALLKRVNAMGGIDSVSAAGIGSAINESGTDGWGVGGMMTYGSSKEKQALGKELLEKLDNYRAAETLAREDKKGERVVKPDGEVVYMSNRQAAEYYAKQESSVAGRKEWQQRFEVDPFGAFKSWSDITNFGATALDSTFRQAPTVIAGTAAMLFNPMIGLAVMNSGNITDQEMQAVNKAVEDEYKRIYGKDADITQLSADEYAKFSIEAAKKGIVSKASAEGVVTGGLMTIAETAMGSAVEKLGGAVLARMPAKELEKTLRNTLSRIGYGSVGYGLKISDEGLQEVSSTIIENVRTGKEWNDGLTQAFLLSAFSVENMAQHGGRAMGKARQMRMGRKAEEEVEKQSTDTNTVEPTQPTEGQIEPSSQDTQAGKAQSGNKVDPKLERASKLIDNIQQNDKGEYVNESGGPTALLDKEGAIKSQRQAFDSELDEIAKEYGFDRSTAEGAKAFGEFVGDYIGKPKSQSNVSSSGNGQTRSATPTSSNLTAEEKNKRLKELHEINERAEANGGVLSDVDRNRIEELESDFEDEHGNQTLMREYNEWQRNGGKVVEPATEQTNAQAQPSTTGEEDLSKLSDYELVTRVGDLIDNIDPAFAEQREKELARLREEMKRRGPTNANRENNRAGTSNADGQTEQQGSNGTNDSGTQRGSEAGQQVPPTQTETPAEGHRESNTQPASDSSRQSDDNSQARNAAGADGRTRETDPTRGEPRELGQSGSEQSGEPTQATGETGTDRGVRERSQSNSVGETLEDPAVDKSYQEALGDNNAYRETDENGIDEAIRKSEENLARYVEEGDQSDVEYEDNYLRQAYARKEQLTGESQLDNYKRSRNELGVTRAEDLQAQKRKQRIDERNQQRERQAADKDVADLGDEIYRTYKKAVDDPLAKDLPQQRERLKALLEEHNERSDNEVDVERYMRKFDERIKKDTTVVERTKVSLERKAEQISQSIEDLSEQLVNLSKAAKSKAVDVYNGTKNKIRKLVQDVKDFLVEAKEKVSTSFAKKFNELKLRADNLLDDIANFKPGQKLLSGKAWGEKTSRSAKKLRDVTNDALKLLPDEKHQKDESADDLFGGLRAKQTGKGASIVTEPTRDEFVRDTNNRIKQERNKALREDQKKRRENELRRVERNTVQDDDGTFSSARDALVKAQEEVAERKREAERKAEADRKQKENEAAYKLHGSRRKYDEIASIKVGKVGSKENIKNLLRATEAISEATEMDNARVAYEKAKELAETIPNKKSRQAKLDEIEQSYAQKRNELKTDTFASREKMEANKAKRDEKRTEAEEEKRKRKDRIRERVRNRKRDSGSTEQSEPQSPVASGGQNPVSDKGTETNTPSDTSTPAQSTKPTSATKPNGRVQDPVNRGEEAARALQEENLASSLKQRFPNTVFDLSGMLEAKNKAGLHDIDSLSAEAHTQLMERIKREDEEYVQYLLDEIAEIHFAIAKARGLIKEHTKDPATPNQWKRIIATGEKGGASVSAVKGAIKSSKHNPANIVPSSKRRVLPFNANQQERLLAVSKMYSKEAMAETDPNAKQNSGVKDKQFWAKREKALFIDEFNALPGTQRETLLRTYDAKDVEQLWEEREKEVEDKNVIGGVAPAGVANMQRFEGIRSTAFVVRASLRLHNEQVESFLNNETGFADLNRTVAEMNLLDEMPRGISNTKLYKEYRASTEKLVNAIADHFGLPHSLFTVSLGGAHGTDGQIARSVDRANQRVIALITLFGRRSAITQASIVFHEVGHFFIHANVDQEHYHQLMNKFKTNDFIKGLMGKGINNAYRRIGEAVQVEEILVDLYAAIKTGDFGRFADRYKIDINDIPAALKEDTSENLVIRIYEKLKSIIADILNLEKVSDKDVRTFLDYLSISDDLIGNNSKFEEAMARLSRNTLLEVMYFHNDKAKEQAINFIDEQLYYADSYEYAKEILDEAEETLGSKDATTLLEAAVDSTTVSSVRENYPLRKFLDGIAKAISGFSVVATIGSMTIPQDAHAHTGYSVYESGPKIENVSQQASDTIHWVTQNKDHNGKAFVVADKAQGKIHIVDTDGKILNTQNAIFGKNKGDNAAFGNTPSGRFLLHKTDTKNLTETDRRVFGDSVLDLTDKETGRKVTNDQGQVVAMHRVVNTAERKAALNSATPNDNYLSHGCINIPTAFYNSAVDKLDGAMVYVLNQDGSSNMSRDTANNSTAKSSNTTRDTSNTVTRGSSLAVPSASPLKFSVKAKNITQVNENVSPEKLQKSLTKALGKFADHISFISREQMGDTAGMQYFIKNGVEGFYDPKTQHAFIVADNIEAQNGISAEERLAFVAWHELTHLGLDVKHGEQLHNILDLAGGNPFIAELARAIQMERTDRGEATSVSDRMAVEEALAELNAALKTDNVKALEERYGVEVPAAFKEDMQSFTDRFIDRIKQLVRKVLGKPSLRNDQIRTLLAGLDESIAKHATPESRMLTERINAYMNDPRTALGDAPRFSIGKVISSAANNAAKFIENMVNKPEAFSPAGAEPSMINAGVEKQKRENALTAGEKFVENFADSDIPAIKYMGGYGTKIAQLLKATKNRVAKQHRKFHNKIQFLQAKAQATAKRMQRKGIYNRNNRHLIDIDVQTGNTALAAITQVMENGKVKFMSMNNELIDKYQKMINGYDAVDQNGNPYHVNGLKDELEAYGYDFANKTFPNYTPYQRQKVNSLLDRYKKATEILAKTEQSQNLILSTKGVKNLDEAKVLRKNLRGHNGMTVAESYNAITRLVKQGKLEITYDGKPWLDYIKDVGFTEDVGFKDITKDYTLNIDNLEVKGEIAQLMKDARDLAKEMYQYAEKEVGKDLTGISHGHPFFTPTMGESKDLKAWYNFDPTDNTAKIEGTQTIDDKITNDEAAEWQSQRLGRAFVGTGMAENLSLLADQVSRRAGWQAIAQQMIKDNDAKLYKVRIIPVTDPKFADTTGIVTAIPLANGKGSRYVKVMLNDTQANAALFGDNVATVGQYGVAKFMSFFNRIVATAITATPIFSVNNAYRGLREKHNQIEAWSGRLPKGSAERYFYDHLSPEIQKELEGGSGTKFGTRLFWTTAYNIARGFIKEGWFGAAVAFAYDMAMQSHSNKNHRLRDFFAGGRSKAAYAKLKAIYDAGGISTRSESFGYSANELSKIYGTGGFWAKGIAAVENFQERAMVFTTAMELVSTLATVDTLNQFGMPRDVAVQANLHFMNFNDRGASATSAWVRASIPFANATTQGARSTTRSVKTRNGWKAGMRRMGMSFAGMMLSAMLRDMFPCDEDLGEESFRDRNDAELMRDLPIRIGCSFEIRLPIAYGADMIFHAAGVSAYQWMTGNWNARQALLSIWHAALENSSPVPQTPANNSGWVQGLTNPIIPRPVRVIWNIARDRDDFDNPLSRQGADDRKVKYLHSKKNTSEVWRSLAQGIHVMGMGNLTPEQARYLVSGFAGPYVVDNIDAATKPLKEGDSRLWKMIKAASGAKSAAREVREPGQASYVKVQNNLKQYQDITDRIDRAIEDPTEKLKFGVTNANTQSWLKKRVEDGTFSGDDIEKAKVILEWRKRQARINSKEVSEERKEQLYLESNEKYLKAIHALEGKGPRW